MWVIEEINEVKDEKGRRLHLFHHLVSEELIFIQDLDCHNLSSLHVFSKLDLAKVALAKGASQLILTHTSSYALQAHSLSIRTQCKEEETGKSSALTGLMTSGSTLKEQDGLASGSLSLLLLILTLTITRLPDLRLYDIHLAHKKTEKRTRNCSCTFSVVPQTPKSKQTQTITSSGHVQHVSGCYSASRAEIHIVIYRNSEPGRRTEYPFIN